MGQQPNANRRPLRSRTTRWASLVARAALKAGLTANQVSFLGVIIAVVGAWALVWGPGQPWLFLVAALGIQLRLLANLIDGLVAVEGGRGGPTGAIWNEFPDRIEDSLFLVAAGYAAALPWLGWLAALLAAVCAYVRLLGATLGQPQDFGGPMAKPHRMAALTIGLLAAFAATIVLPYGDRGQDIVPPEGNLDVFVILAGTTGIIVVGTLLTIALRLSRLSKALRG